MFVPTTWLRPSTAILRLTVKRLDDAEARDEVESPEMESAGEVRSEMHPVGERVRLKAVDERLAVEGRRRPVKQARGGIERKPERQPAPQLLVAPGELRFRHFPDSNGVRLETRGLR